MLKLIRDVCLRQRRGKDGAVEIRALHAKRGGHADRTSGGHGWRIAMDLNELENAIAAKK